jgi:hypothetical protein
MIKLIRKPVKNVLAYQATVCREKQHASVVQCYLRVNKLQDASHSIVLLEYTINQIKQLNA